MGAMRRLLLVLALGHASMGCTTISVGRYQSAAPLGKGNSQLTIGMQLPKDGGHGIDRQNEPGESVTQHSAGALLNNFDVNFHQGLTDRLEASAQLYLWGGKLGARYTWLNSRMLKASIGGAIGGAWGTYQYDDKRAAQSGGTLRTGGTVGVDYYDFPATFSLHPSPDFAIFGGPVLTRVNAYASLKDEDLGNNTTGPVYQRRARLWSPGAFFGATIGRKVQLTPGICFYREPTQHPADDSKRHAIFGYPFLGLSFVQQSPKHRRTPATTTPVDQGRGLDPVVPLPPPEPTPEPSPSATPEPTPTQ